MANRESMVGKWRFASSDGFDSYLKALGINFAIRKLANLSKPDVVVELNGDEFCYKSISTARTTEIKCTVGKEFEEMMPDKSKTKSIMNWDGHKLVHKQEWDGRVSTSTRYVDDDGLLVMEFVLDDAKCIRKFKREA